MNMQLTGVKLRRNPTKALMVLLVKAFVKDTRDVHWCRVTESLSQFTSNLVLGREVKLLEELG